jgi:hypothetical protein
VRLPVLYFPDSSTADGGEEPAGAGDAGGHWQPLPQAPVGGDHQQVVVAVGQLPGDRGEGVVPTSLGPDQPHAVRSSDLAGPSLDGLLDDPARPATEAMWNLEVG